MNFYLAGQTTFGNRGCEALVRGTTHMIRERMPDATLSCPLDNLALDAPQWPDAAASGIRFVSGPRFPRRMRWWARANRVLPLEGTGLPPFPLDDDTAAHIRRADAVIMTGGDILTLDYSVMSLYQWSRMIENAMNHGVPVVLWAASIGPFSARPAVERVMAKHLRRYAAITVRESTTLEYLRSLGIDHAELVADPAFHLQPEAFETDICMPARDRPRLGFNVSPLIRKFRGDEGSARAMDREIQAFLRHIVETTDLSVVLVPHVGSLDGSSWNSDWHYMRTLHKELAPFHDRITLAPPTLNAAQLKFLIGECQYFIGARTHATIAALSQGVPTISIAYSTKAKGINHDLFGDTRYVLDTPSVSLNSLGSALALLQVDESAIRSQLREKLPEWRQRATRSVDALARILTADR